MIAGNIFKWIGNFFEWTFSFSFDVFRLGDFDWWSSNIINWIFMGVLLVLFAYWMWNLSVFIKEGTEDKA